MSPGPDDGAERPSDGPRDGLETIDAKGEMAAYTDLTKEINSSPTGSEEATSADDEDSSTGDRSLKERIALIVIVLELVALSIELLLRVFDFITKYLLPLLRGVIQVLRILGVVSPSISVEEE